LEQEWHWTVLGDGREAAEGHEGEVEKRQRTELALHPVLEAQAGDAAEGGFVVGDQGEVTCFRCGGDQQIQSLYRHSLPPQIGLDLPEDAGFLLTYGEDREPAHETIDCPVILCGATGLLSPMAELSESDNGYREGCCATLLDDASNMVTHDGPTTQPENAGIGVEQKAHSAGASLLESLAS